MSAPPRPARPPRSQSPSNAGPPTPSRTGRQNLRGSMERGAPRGRGVQNPRGTPPIRARPQSCNPFNVTRGNESPKRTPPAVPVRTESATFNKIPPKAPPRNASPAPATPPRGPTRASRSSRNRAPSIIFDDNDKPLGPTPATPNLLRDTIANSIICLDQEEFMEQIRAEETRERTMSFVRREVPLPVIPSPSRKLKFSSPKCQEFLDNFIKQEMEYIKKMNNIIENVMEPVRTKSILSSFQIVSLFSRLESVVELSQNILNEIQGVFTNSSVDLDDNELLASIADVFEAKVDEFSVYVTYCANLPSVGQRIMAYKIDYESFDTLIAEWEKSSGNHLKETLFLPKSRIESYHSYLKFIKGQIQEVKSEPIPDSSMSATIWGNGHKPILQKFPCSTQIMRVSCGNTFYAALMDDASVWVWGNSSKGALGLGSVSSIDIPQKIESLQGVKDISSGNDILACITDDDKLLLTGSLPDNSQQFQIPTEYNWEHEGTIRTIYFSDTFAIIMTEDQFGSGLWSWGTGSKGQLGLGDITFADKPTLIEDLTGYQVTNLTISSLNVMALTVSNEIFIWGSNTESCIGVSNSSPFIPKPEAYTSLEDEEFTNICCGDEYFYAITTSGVIYGWGNIRNDGMLGSSNNPESISSLKNCGIIRINSGGTYCIGLSQNGKIYSWGNGNSYKTGQNNTNVLTTPTIIKTLENSQVFQIYCASQSTIVVHSTPDPVTCSTRVNMALTSMEENVNSMVEQIRQVENISKLLEIDLFMVNSKDYSIVNQNRLFIMKANAKVNGSDGLVVLFDDSILLSKKKDKKNFEIQHHIEFESCVLGNTSESGSKANFEIRDSKKVSRFNIIEFPFKNERDLWIARIKQQLEQYSQNVEEKQTTDRPPSYFPPAPPQKDSPLSNVSLTDVQANLKNKTKNFRIPRFSSKAMHSKLEKITTTLSNQPLLTTEGASEPMEKSLPPHSQLKMQSSQSSPALPTKPIIPGQLPQLPPTPGLQKPVIPAKPSVDTTPLPELPKLPQTPSSTPPKPKIPLKPELSDTSKKLIDPNILLQQIRECLEIDESVDILETIKALKQKIDSFENNN